jgi:hypothetical protein
MDEDTADLVAQLCTRIRMIIEDASAIALTIGSADAVDRPAALQQLNESAERTDALVRAALALDNREPV